VRRGGVRGLEERWEVVGAVVVVVGSVGWCLK